MKVSLFIICMGLNLGIFNMSHSLGKDFVFLSDIAPSIIQNVRYHSAENFLGRQVHGYETNRVICTEQAALRLNEAQKYFNAQGYNIVVYDGYRPQRAVNDFLKWSKDITDIKMKKKYYPTLNKDKLFSLGYLAEKSSHSRGSTFDLTLIEIGKQVNEQIKTLERRLESDEFIPFLDDNTLDMGSSFDLFHQASHHNSPVIGYPYTRYRNLLRLGMQRFNFIPYAQEWWHYTLKGEPFPDTYFDFVYDNRK